MLKSLVFFMFKFFVQSCGIFLKIDVFFSIFRLNLATLCLMSVPTNMVSARTSDSCTLDMAAWFGFPGNFTHKV